MMQLTHQQLCIFFCPPEAKCWFTLNDWQDARWPWATKTVSSNTAGSVDHVGSQAIWRYLFCVLTTVYWEVLLIVFIFKYVQMWLKETLMKIVEIWPFKVWCCWIRVWRNSYRINQRWAWSNKDAGLKHRDIKCPSWWKWNFRGRKII